MSEADHRQTDDHAKTVHGSGSITEVKLVGFDKPFMSALAVGLAVAAIMYTGWTSLQLSDRVDKAEKEARLAQYYNIDLEVYMAKQNLTPPPDPWRKKGPSK